MMKKSVPEDDQETGENILPKNEPEVVFKEGSPDNDFDEIFNNWLIEAGGAVDGRQFRVFVRKYQKDKSFKWVETFNNRFPQIEEIAYKWGGGKFQIQYNLLGVPKTPGKPWKRNTSTMIEIDEYYDEILKENREIARRERLGNMPGIGGGSFPGQPGATSSNDAVGQAIGLTQAMVNMVQQLTEGAQAKQPAAPFDVYRHLNTLAEDMVRQNLKTITGIRNQALREIPFGNGQAPAPAPASFQVVPPADNPLANLIGGLIEEYAPKILGGGAIGDQAVEYIKSMIPRFPQITGDPGAMQLIVNTCAERLGGDKTKELFSRIGIPLQ